MPSPRSSQICLEQTPFYHCVSRVVRRAYLCGKDSVSGRCYDHRRNWVEKRILQLAKVFSIDVAAYAVMSNHLHVVLRVNQSGANLLSPASIAERWLSLFKGTTALREIAAGETQGRSDEEQLEVVAIYRQRLACISWFMRCLNEPIARQANAEDECTGRFWEGRFKSQALLDERAVITCMAYVDLNPVRAQESKLPEHGPYTSLRLRVEAASKGLEPKSLLPFQADSFRDERCSIGISLRDYLQLVDATGRAIVEGKSGSISDGVSDILSRLSLAKDNWLEHTSRFEAQFRGAAGSPESLTAYCIQTHRRRRPNTGIAPSLTFH
ncbi:transposase [Paraferrimonas sedimenticola]|uniref:transposase n=1 Tax=Paraferrimonas sedimenticola TaxID=375674 RepID=UPI000BA9BDD1|nr:transposase [Paraferrimonas sedimenticola]